MEVELSYGREGLKVVIPDKNIVKIFKMKENLPLKAPSSIIQKSLLFPIGSRSLHTLASTRKNACIVISDKTRPVPNKIILPPLLDVLEASGIKRKNIVILIATGAHLPPEGKDLLELVGKQIIEKYRVVSHNPWDKELNIFIGRTASGTPVIINRIYYYAELKILTGFIEPHFMTGFSGGRKSICPGISSIETIRVFHSPKFLESPLAAPGIIEGNPCHKEAMEIAHMAGVDFILNVTLNSKKEITGVFAGDIQKAYEAGIRFCRAQVTDYIEDMVDIVITTGGGYPLDCTLYQTVKGMVSAGRIVKQGGTIIIASMCSEGIGSPEFKKLLSEMQSPDEFLEMIQREDYFILDQWQVEELVKVLKKAKVKIYSEGLKGKEKMLSPHLHLVESIEESLAEYGQKAKIAVIPDGPYVIAELKKGEQ